MKLLRIILLLSFVIPIHILSQKINIIPALKKVEEGDLQSARNILKDLKQESPENPSVLFLDAVLTDNGEDALFKYHDVYNKYPKSKYADASVYRVFSYYYALGIYKKAETYKKLLLKKYPHSPYIKAANRNIPDVEFENVSRKNVPVKEIPSDNKNKFTVQAGAFLNIANAKKLRSNLISSGFKAEVTAKDIGGSIFNVVTAGKFSSKNDARNFLNFLKSDFNITGRIIPINK